MKINIKNEREKLHLHLKNLGIYEAIDTNQIEIYLVNLKSYWDYEEYFKTNNRTLVVNAAGYSQQVPEVNFQKENWTVIQKLSSEFGLTPKARNTIKAEKNKVEEDEFERIKKGK